MNLGCVSGVPQLWSAVLFIFVVLPGEKWLVMEGGGEWRLCLGERFNSMLEWARPIKYSFINHWRRGAGWTSQAYGDGSHLLRLPWPPSIAWPGAWCQGLSRETTQLGWDLSTNILSLFLLFALCQFSRAGITLIVMTVWARQTKHSEQTGCQKWTVTAVWCNSVFYIL